MAKEELIQFEGLVTEILPDARYRVQLDAGHEIVAYTAGKMKKNRIKTLAGDRVTIEMSPYDLEKGRLIFRHKDERPGRRRSPARRTAARPVPRAGKPPTYRHASEPRAMTLSCRRAVGGLCTAAKSGRSKNRAPQDCFEGLLRIIYAPSIFGRTTLAIHRYSRFRR